MSQNVHILLKMRERKLAMETTAKVIAVSGKGGVGKTTLAATMVRHLTECKPDARILAIDADPAVGLSTGRSLG